MMSRKDERQQKLIAKHSRKLLLQSNKIVFAKLLMIMIFTLTIICKLILFMCQSQSMAQTMAPKWSVYKWWRTGTQMSRTVTVRIIQSCTESTKKRNYFTIQFLNLYHSVTNVAVSANWYLVLIGLTKERRCTSAGSA